MNNIIVLTPRDTEDYGVYVCHATNSFGSTAYKITVSEYQKGESYQYYNTLQHRGILKICQKANCVVTLHLVLSFRSG